MEGEQGLFVAVPSKKSNNNEYKDIVHLICSELRKCCTGEIEEKFSLMRR